MDYVQKYFPEGYFHENFWPENSGAGLPEQNPPGYWQVGVFPNGFYGPGFWPEYGAAVIPPIPPDVGSAYGGGGFVSKYGWIDSSLEDRIIDEDNEIMMLLANILPIIIG